MKIREAGSTHRWVLIIDLVSSQKAKGKIRTLGEEMSIHRLETTILISESKKE